MKRLPLSQPSMHEDTAFVAVSSDLADLPPRSPDVALFSLAPQTAKEASKIGLLKILLKTLRDIHSYQKLKRWRVNEFTQLQQ
jgi:hypothetical protein